MPRAIVITATAANPGRLRRVLAANFRSWSRVSISRRIEDRRWKIEDGESTVEAGG
jgi:hypothetical protein